MGGNCSAGCSPDEVNEGETMVDISRLDLASVKILDFERRVKKYAHPINKGRVTVDQLFESFADTEIFSQLRNPFSVVYKLLLSPFFRTLHLTHYEKLPQEAYQKDVYVLSEANMYNNEK